MGRNDKEWIAIASIIYVIILLALQCLQTARGGLVTLYAIIAMVTICQALHQSLSRRIWAVIATLLAILLLLQDHQRRHADHLQYSGDANSFHLHEAQKII